MGVEAGEYAGMKKVEFIKQTLDFKEGKIWVDGAHQKKQQEMAVVKENNDLRLRVSELEKKLAEK